MGPLTPLTRRDIHAADIAMVKRSSKEQLLHESIRSLTAEERTSEDILVDISNIMNPSPYSVQLTAPMGNVHTLFRAIGLRHGKDYAPHLACTRLRQRHFDGAYYSFLCVS
jgi:hypothetical protein